MAQDSVGEPGLTSHNAHCRVMLELIGYRRSDPASVDKFRPQCIDLSLIQSAPLVRTALSSFPAFFALLFLNKIVIRCTFGIPLYRDKSVWSTHHSQSCLIS